MPKHQYSLDLISHQVKNSVIQQRSSDGYINATELCNAAGKRWHHYVTHEPNGHFLRALAAKTDISVASLAEEVRSPSGDVSVWVHPRVSTHLAQWVSPEFAVLVSEWVLDWMSGIGGPTARKLPPHIERHMRNVGKVPTSHFSVLQEMTLTLIAPLEAHGYELPTEMVPDISQGLMFARHAREQLGLDTDELPTYDHEYNDGRVYPAKLYPVDYLGHFRTFINKVWMPERAEDYFKKRDPQALPYLDKVLQISYDGPRPPSLPRPARKRSA